MQKCIIFGAGFYGKGAYYKLKKYYDIAYYVDNNKGIQGNLLHGIQILSLEQMREVLKEEYDIIICSTAYYEMANQLIAIGIYDYYVMLEGFLYHFDEDEVMMPKELTDIKGYKKEKEEKNILFVQNTACIRTHKIASMMKEKGYKVFLLYTIAPPESNNASFGKIYDEIFTVFTANTFIQFINESDFDIIHSSNEPDSLTNYLLLTNKKIVFDTHDMMSLCGYDRLDTWTLEYLANTKSSGVIYTSQGVADIARRKFGLDKQNIFVLENYILKQMHIEKKYEKLSKLDGQLHCVYEGGINGKDTEDARYFEKIWSKITDCGIHIHFYSQSNYDYCVELENKNKYLHFEGNIGSQELASEMTKYDCGLAIMNINDRNRVLYETASPNKINEYINSGLPVAVGKVKSAIEFVRKYNIGDYLDLNGDIFNQLKGICKIHIDESFLEKNKLTMNSYSDDLENFYRSIIERE